ncbi:TIGR04197 family type VII secretion effector [Pseudogracilibacillus sp. SE30717A]|uniref:TIGR04197 family type VII secretion effector n=1 Tax=Pseudogracilibacillus sp. SE30717A TaxID=3098293 RepID=UPI00300E220E
MGKISINMAEFNSNVSSLNSSIAEVDTGISTGETFDTTNLKPFTENLEVLIQLINQLDAYKAHFKNDIDVLESVGESLQEQDNKLASNKSAAANSGGYEPIHV